MTLFLFDCVSSYDSKLAGMVEHEETLILTPVLFLTIKVAWGKVLHLFELQFLL